MKLHLGCGPRVIPGWVHVDVSDHPHVQLRHEVDSLPMIADGSVETAYACHVLEHFLRREVPRVLREWHRILAPRGVLRIAVPDFAALVKVYRATGELNAVIGPLFGRQDGLYNFHHTIFDFESLRSELTSAGFVDVHRYDWRLTEHAHIDDYSQAYYPHMDREKGTLISLNVEAVKP